MSDALATGVVTELVPGVRRLIAPNASLMTGPGTNTYLLGEREIAVIDPGPAIAAHVRQIADDAGAPIRWILVTHTHPDHSPAARSLAAATGAETLGIPAPDGRHQDKTFVPDRRLGDGDTFSTGEFELRVIHTPGHASNHLCYLHAEHGWLFTGDHIINGSTVVIDPPDGSMSQYLDSLVRLKGEEIRVIAPGHGAPLDAPYDAIEWLIEHRLKREAKVIDRLGRLTDAALAELVRAVYDEVSESLHRLAERSLLAHLLKLEEEGRALRTGDRWRLADAGNRQDDVS